MSAFSALLASVGDKKQQSNPAQSSTPLASGANQAAKHKNAPNGVRQQQPQQNGVKPAVPNVVRPPVPSQPVAASLKRKAEDQDGQPRAKTPKTEQNAGPARPPPPPRQVSSSSNVKPSVPNPAVAKPSAPISRASVPYRGTARPIAPVIPASANPKAVLQPTTSGPPITTPATNDAPKAKKGFAATLAKAQAAQAAAKASPSTIVHKPAEKLTKRERDKLRQEALDKEKAAAKHGKLKVPGLKGVDRSRSGTPVDGKKNAAAPTAYSGTMKKPAEKISYSGTMRAAQPGEVRPPAANAKKKKDIGQDKYGGYASWSDLDEVEDEEEGGYDESDLSDMEAGFDDEAREDELALRAARKEDQEALEEEARLKREKEERKKKLVALSKGAAAKKRF